MKKGSIIIDHSSVTPVESNECYYELRRWESVSWTHQFLAESGGNSWHSSDNGWWRPGSI